jgi:hypothetical protein
MDCSRTAALTSSVYRGYAHSRLASMKIVKDALLSYQPNKILNMEAFFSSMKSSYSFQAMSLSMLHNISTLGRILVIISISPSHDIRSINIVCNNIRVFYDASLGPIIKFINSIIKIRKILFEH